MKTFKSQNRWIVIGGKIPSLSSAWEFVQDPACGATQMFTGTTRNHHDGKTVTGLYYDCYEEMALKEAGKLLEGLMKQFDVMRVVLFHKCGEVPVGEISLVTAISAAHRAPALEATSILINRIKETLPVWKREEFESEGTLWKEEQMVIPGKSTGGKNND